MDIERSRSARKAAQDALVALLHQVSDYDPPLIVLGGLVPDLLTRDQDFPVPRHLGTTDVDMLVDLRTDADEDLSPIEAALQRLGFLPESGSEGWRWLARMGGAHIKLEFLTELEDVQVQHVFRPVGCRVLGAMNLRGPGYVREDWHLEKLAGTLPGGETVIVEARVAGLSGYLLAKAAAARERGLEKDYYDFAYILIYNRLGGPAQAARELREGKFAGRLKAMETIWREIADRFGAPDRIGPIGYAAQALLVDPAAEEARLRQDALAAVSEFMEALDVL